MKIDLRLGDCIEVLKTLEDNSVDSIVTDPPYGLSFMNKKWDYDVPSTEVWKECLRVLKPGGHLLSFAGSRTYHRMAVRIEDAGFEIRDQLMWVFGSGFPKSHNIGKAIDKIQGNESKIKGFVPRYPEGTRGEKSTGDSSWFGGNGFEEQPGMKPVYEINNDWEGWGTALKPAHEPIVMARKPLTEKSIAENVLRWGTGGINIDGCRIGFSENDDPRIGKGYEWESKAEPFGQANSTQIKEGWNTEGRFPANIMFDEEAGKLLDEQSGVSKSAGSVRKKDTNTDPSSMDFKHKEGENSNPYAGQIGGASRFFYCPKVSKKERNAGLDDMEEKHNKFGNQKNGNDIGNGSVNDRFTTKPRKNHHPTVKPIKLMEYLIKLVTPQGGIVLEPFMGSGSTGIAAKNLGMSFIGIEKEEEYMEIAKQRIENN